VFEDYLHRELPKIELPETRHACPQCALALTGKETKCPRCGIPLAGVAPAEEMLECPECGALAPASALSCPRCGVGFAEAPEAPAPPPPVEEPVPPSPPQPEPVPASPPPDMTRPITVPAPAPPTGFVNGRGTTERTGFVNGTGMINGTRGEARAPRPRRVALALTRWQFLAVLVAVVIIIPTFVFLSFSAERPTLAIDGDFGDWKDVRKFSMYAQAASPSVDVDQWAFEIDGSKVYIYFSTAAETMSSSAVESFYLFIDSDDTPSTGYSVQGLGADFLVQIDGWNGSVHAASLSAYDPHTTDHIDWNSWESVGGATALVAGSRVEAVAELPVVLSGSARLLLVSKDSLERSSVSYSMPVSRNLLVVELMKGPGVSQEGMVPPLASVAMMTIRLSSIGSDGTVHAIYPSAEGVTLVGQIQDISVTEGEAKTVDVLVDASALAAGEFVSVDLQEMGVDSTFSDVEVLGEAVRAYVDSAPSAIAIDGAFGDWAGLTAADSDSVPVANENIDIDSVGAVNDTATSYFYVSVHGAMCDGSYVPVIKQLPTGGGGGVVIPTRKTGEDVLRIFIDSDVDQSTGAAMSLSSKVIGADYMLEVKGLNGVITSRSLMVYSAGQWSYGSAAVSAANDRQRLEISVSAASIGGSSSLDFIVETTDWRQRTDYATAVPQGTRTLSGGLPTGAGLDSWIVDGTTTSNAATAMSYQRKLFHDGVNFWSFHWDGANTIYKYSSDGGQTWTAAGQAFSTAGVNEASVWYEPGTHTVYIVGDRSAASVSVCVRRGTVDPGTHSIAWSGNDVALNTSSNPLGGKNAYISRDPSGYIWVVSSNMTSTSPTRYTLSVFRSVATDSISSWLFSGNLVVPSQAGANLKGSVVHVGTGTAMLAVYVYLGSVYSRLFTGTWSAENTIYSNADNPGNTDNAPPCVVVDARGTAHVVYGNGHQQSLISKPYIYYVYYNSNGWSVPLRLDTVSNNLGNVYPTVSVDSSTGNVWAFWIETGTDGIGYIVRAKKNVSGVWSFFPLNGDTSYAKQYLTSVFSASSEQFVAFQWTQNSTAPIHVMFDKIPEFGDLVVPVLSLIVIFFVVHRRRHRRARGA